MQYSGLVMNFKKNRYKREREKRERERDQKNNNNNKDAEDEVPILTRSIERETHREASRQSKDMYFQQRETERKWRRKESIPPPCVKKGKRLRNIQKRNYRESNNSKEE